MIVLFCPVQWLSCWSTALTFGLNCTSRQLFNTAMISQWLSELIHAPNNIFCSTDNELSFQGLNFFVSNILSLLSFLPPCLYSTLSSHLSLSYWCRLYAQGCRLACWQTVPIRLALGQGADNESPGSGCLLASLDAEMPQWSASWWTETPSPISAFGARAPLAPTPRTKLGAQAQGAAVEAEVGQGPPPSVRLSPLQGPERQGMEVKMVCW